MYSENVQNARTPLSPPWFKVLRLNLSDRYVPIPFFSMKQTSLRNQHIVPSRLSHRFHNIKCWKLSAPFRRDRGDSWRGNGEIIGLVMCLSDGSKKTDVPYTSFHWYCLAGWASPAALERVQSLRRAKALLRRSVCVQGSVRARSQLWGERVFHSHRWGGWGMKSIWDHRREMFILHLNPSFSFLITSVFVCSPPPPRPPPPFSGCGRYPPP